MTEASRDRVIRLAFALTLALLLAHAALYRFLCDDAFISFRYAHNLAQGHGLVFNPGHERVEGYTNFLWVVVLAAFDAAGIAPERAAPGLLLALTVVLWGLVARASWRWIPDGPWRFVVPLPAAWLALTRSVAVWSTSGLETRLFEVLVVAGVLRLADDVAAAGGPGRRRMPWGALLLALAALTRPDGMLIGGAAMAAAAGVLALRRRLSLADAVGHAVVFGSIVGAHLLFRHAYYGEWVPNTYFAKVGGRSWWGMGTAYLACFSIEYAAWLWIPAMIAGVQGFLADRRAEIPVLIAAVIVPHVLYVASIGGDHFEFRPLDLYFPFLFLLMGRGLAALLAGVLPRWGVSLYAALIAAGLVAIPWRSHVEFTHEYAVGFPGLGSTRGERLDFLDPRRNPFYRWPGLRFFAEAHRQLLRSTTSRLVGVRQEEHALFLGTVAPEGRRLRALVADGTLPSDTHVAMSAVGAMPYYSDLRTLDRLGLTDAVVAKSAPGELRVMAHDRHATLEYAERAGVDLWTEHPVHLLARADDDNLVWRLEQARTEGSPVYFADAGDGDYVIARLPQGLERTAVRFPRLVFHPAGDDAAYAGLLDAVIEAHRRTLARDPAARDARLSLGSALAARGRDDEALPIFRALAEAGDADGWYNLGTIQVRHGAPGEAIEAFRRALAIDPDMGPARHNLGLALARSGRVDEAVTELREAVRREPESERAIYTLGVALEMAGDSPRGRVVRRGTPVGRHGGGRGVGRPPGPSDPRTRGPRPVKRGVVTALGVVGLLAALAYVRGLPGEFVYDDHRLIVDNDGLKRPFEPARAFTRDYYASDTDRTVLGYYRPIALLSNEFDYRRGGGRALPFHLTNVALHVAATLLVFALARRLAAGSVLAATVAAGLFALHPAHAESVAFISGRVDPLAAVCVLASVLCHLLANRSGSPWRWRAAASAAWLGGLCSKEMAVTAPLIAAMLELGEEGLPEPGAWARRAARYALYIPAAGIYLLLRAIALGGLLGPPTGEGGLAFAPPFVALGTYLRWLVLPPFGLNLEPVPDGAAWLVRAGVAIVLAIALAWVLWKRGRHVELATLGAVAIALIPVLQFRPIETALSERFLYLPSALAMTLAGELAARAGSRRLRAAALTAAVLLAGAYAAILLPRAALWRDELALWNAKEREDHGSLKARLNIARVEHGRGNDDAARRAYDGAMALAPGLAPQIRAEMSSLLGDAPSETRDADLRAAIAASPGDGSLWSNLGYLALERGDLDSAGEAFARSIALTPLRAPAWLGSSLVRLRRADYDGALRDAVEAVRLDPTLALARAVEGECLLRAGKACEALQAVDGLRLEDPGQQRMLEGVRRAAEKTCPSTSR